MKTTPLALGHALLGPATRRNDMRGAVRRMIDGMAHPRLNANAAARGRLMLLGWFFASYSVVLAAALFVAF